MLPRTPRLLNSTNPAIASAQSKTAQSTAGGSRRRLSWLAGALLILCACNKPGASPSETAAPSPTAAAIERFGDPLSGLTDVPLKSLISAPAQFDGKAISVQGKVRKACSAKGCWMELADEETGPGCRVTFKNYGFFVPTDSAGAVARLEGKVATKRVSKQRVEHWESEGATFPNKNDDGTANEVRIVATGVELRR